jgi:hypothetical protein
MSARQFAARRHNPAAGMVKPADMAARAHNPTRAPLAARCGRPGIELQGNAWTSLRLFGY